MKTKIAIIGQGYVGLPLARECVMASYEVLGIDSNKDLIKNLKDGKSHIDDVSDVELAQMLRDHIYLPTTDYRLIAEAQVIIICVPTPLDLGHQEPDYSYLDSCIDSLIENLRPGTLIVNESTCAPGTVRNRIVPRIFGSRPELEGKLLFSVAPERINPGYRDLSFRQIPRVIGALNVDSQMRTLEIYAKLVDDLKVVKSLEVAELSKLLENSFRQINISFINEFNDICRSIGVETYDVIEAASTKPYGFSPFYPSAGIGGHCIPVDPVYLSSFAKSVGCELSMVDVAQQINQNRPLRVYQKVKAVLSDRGIKRVLLLGVTYKSGVADTRESPAEKLVDFFQRQDIHVGWQDPMISQWNGTSPSDIGEGWDCVLILTQHELHPIPFLIEQEIPVFDLSGGYRNYLDIWQI